MTGQRRQAASKTLTERPEFPFCAAPVQFAHDDRGFGQTGGVQGETGDAGATLAVAQFQPHLAQGGEGLSSGRIQSDGKSDPGNRGG